MVDVHLYMIIINLWYNSICNLNVMLMGEDLRFQLRQAQWKSPLGEFIFLVNSKNKNSPKGDFHCAGLNCPSNTGNICHCKYTIFETTHHFITSPYFQQ